MGVVKSCGILARYHLSSWEQAVDCWAPHQCKCLCACVFLNVSGSMLHWEKIWVKINFRKIVVLLNGLFSLFVVVFYCNYPVSNLNALRFGKRDYGSLNSFELFFCLSGARTKLEGITMILIICSCCKHTIDITVHL